VLPCSAATVSSRLAEAEATEATINAARESYRGPPARASALWFVVTDLSRLSPMYHTSLAAFKAIYATCVRASVARKQGPAAAVATAAAPAAAAVAAAAAAGSTGAGAGEALQIQLAALTDLITAHIYATVSCLIVQWVPCLDIAAMLGLSPSTPSQEAKHPACGITHPACRPAVDVPQLLPLPLSTTLSLGVPWCV
jgi:hypothetical protein